MEIKKEFDNRLLNRKEVVADIETKGATISREEAKKQLAKKLKADEELIIVEEISSHFGSRNVSVYANLYDDRKSLEKISLKHIVKRNQAPAQEEAEAEA